MAITGKISYTGKEEERVSYRRSWPKKLLKEDGCREVERSWECLELAIRAYDGLGCSRCGLVRFIVKPQTAPHMRFEIFRNRKPHRITSKPRYPVRFNAGGLDVRAVQMRTIIGGGNGGTNLGHLFKFAAYQFSDAGALLSAQHIVECLYQHPLGYWVWVRVHENAAYVAAENNVSKTPTPRPSFAAFSCVLLATPKNARFGVLGDDDVGMMLILVTLSNVPTKRSPNGKQIPVSIPISLQNLTSDFDCLTNDQIQSFTDRQLTLTALIHRRVEEMETTSKWRRRRGGGAQSLDRNLSRKIRGFLSRRFLFRFVLVMLAVMAILPPVYFHFKLRRFHQAQLRKCSWLNNPPLVCAHGGDASKAFPNTMDAYRIAIRSQVDCIEIDVSRSSDGVLFALHDRDLQQISGNTSSKVGYMSAKEIKALGAIIPTMEDALKLISSSVEKVVVDAKVGPPSYEKGLATDILSLVKKTQCKNCVVWAKSDNLVRDVIKQSPDVKVGYIVMMNFSSGMRTNLLRMKNAQVVGIFHALVDDAVVKILHRRKKKVYAWTVDDEPTMHEMLYQNVDAIITSNPTLLQTSMRDIRKKCAQKCR
ncbi:hypothetical protein LXL04_007732 [Taraxacum kok-saghyz]